MESVMQLYPKNSIAKHIYGASVCSTVFAGQADITMLSY